MAVVITKSNLITNFEASPPKLSKALVAGGRLREIAATVAVAAADDDGSIFLLAPVFSLVRISKIWIYNTAITGGTGYDVGLFDTNGVAVDDDAYASAVSMATARTDPLNVAFEARSIAAIQNQIWQDAGLTEQNELMYYLGLIGDVVGTAAGTISAQIEYCDGS